MGLFEKIFGNRPKVPERDYEGFFKMLNGYTPHFTSWSGGIYESEMVRSAISTLATHISKLNVETVGSAKPALQKKLRNGPNEFQTWAQFMQRAATIFYIHNTCIITPIWDEFGQISGIYTPVPSRCELVQYAGKPFIRYEFGWGEKAAVELENVGIMVRMQYRNDFFGESNRALLPTMELIHIQNQGIEEGVKSAATYRFMATLNNWSTDEDLAKERKRFSANNFARDADAGGLLLFPNTYGNIKQLEVKPWVVDADQMRAIAASVCEYFGVNEAVMTNKAIGDEWAAFYEGAVEPFSIQFSEVLTKMLFTFREQTAGNKVIATANRLQYMSARDKLDYSAQMADRGLVTRNEIREMWNLAPLPEPYGSQLPVRGEYYNVGDEENDPENSQ
jgi:hypothetical protein